MHSVDAADRARGLMLGLAAGDRNGGPLRMALELGDSLLELGRFSAPDVLHRYLTWFQAGGFDTGPVAAGVFRLALRGVPAHDAVVKVHERSERLTAGCNPAHRIGPLAAAACVPDEALVAAATKEAALTHLDPLAGEVAAAVAVLCRGLVRGASWEEALEASRDGRTHEVQSALTPMRYITLDSSGFAPAVLRAAVWFVAESSGPDEAVRGAVSFAGPENYAPVLAGVIAGARWGASRIEPTSLAHVGELRERVEAQAGRLAEGWG